MNITLNDLECAAFIFKTAGLGGDHLVMALNSMYKFYTGKDALEAGNIQLDPVALTPSEIARILGIKTRNVNFLLEAAEYQFKLCGEWRPLPKGMPYALIQEDGSLKWNSSVLGVMEKWLKE